MKLGKHAYIHMLYVFVALAVVMDLIQVSYSYPNYMSNCNMIISSSPGASFNRMGVSTYSSLTTSCSISYSGGSTTFNACEDYVLTVSSTSNLANAIAASAGEFNADRLGTQTRCAYTASKVRSKTYSFKAPPSGTVTISAICGDYNEMNAASKITLSLSPTSAPRINCNPTTSPTMNPTRSSSPSISPTKKPSISPTKSPTTAIPTSTSPTTTPTIPTSLPTSSPLKPNTPTKAPQTGSPTSVPTTKAPTHIPTSNPSTLSPSTGPISLSPTISPTTLRPTTSPINGTISSPSAAPTQTIAVGSLSPSASSVVSTKTPSAGVKTLSNLGTNLLSVQFEPTSTVTTFTLENTNKGWIGFGISSSGNMVGGKVVIGMDPTVNNGFSAVQLYNIAGKTVSAITALSTDATLSSTYGIVNASFTIGASSSVLKFSILNEKQNDQFILVNKDSKPTIIYAIGDNEFGYHNFRSSKASVDFSTTDSSGGNGETQAYSVSTVVMLHVAVMILAYLILFPIGVSMPLFNNKKYNGQKLCGLKGSQWFMAHKIVQSIGLLFALIGFIAIVVYVDEEEHGHFNTDHKNLGLAVIIGSILNPIYGFLRPHKPKEGEAVPFSRTVFEVFHPLFGYTVLICGFANCFIGVYQFQTIVGSDTYTYNGNTGKTGFGGAIGISVIVLGVIFILLITLGLLIRLLGRITAESGMSEKDSLRDQAKLQGGSTFLQSEDFQKANANAADVEKNAPSDAASKHANENEQKIPNELVLQ